MSDQPIPTPRCDVEKFFTRDGIDVVRYYFACTLERELWLKNEQMEAWATRAKAHQQKADCLERKYLPCPDCRDKTKDGECLRCKVQSLQSERDKLQRTVDFLQRHNDATVDDSQLIAMARERDQLREALERARERHDEVYAAFTKLEAQFLNHSKSPTK